MKAGIMDDLEEGVVTIHVVWVDEDNVSRQTILKRFRNKTREQGNGILLRAKERNPGLDLWGMWQAYPKHLG